MDRGARQAAVHGVDLATKPTSQIDKISSLSIIIFFSQKKIFILAHNMFIITTNIDLLFMSTIAGSIRNNIK